MKVKHICSVGHVFHKEMEYVEKGKLTYSSWNNNLCNIGMCDRVGIIIDDEVKSESN
ncbi:hypothetical protein [Metabacillus fastidiosus]|uniref:hypothetical protein n=1 Tax=Metabacillus fastidiosus TaxID=1458 RepID=UPI003D2AB32A